MNTGRNAWFGVLVIACLLGCVEAPPPPPETLPPAPKPEPEPEPPPPPKCEAIKEQCKSTSDTKARIPGTHYVFQPPEGWVYAQLEECTVAQVGESGAVLMLSTHEKLAKLKLNKKRGELVLSLSELVGITPKKKRDNFYRPNQKSEIAGLDMSLWERSGAKRADDVGGLLILSAPLGDVVLFGVGYAPRSDDEGTGKILKALQTLAEGEKKEDDSEGGKDEEGADEGKKK
jgi:hypothetical protein